MSSASRNVRKTIESRRDGQEDVVSRHSRTIAASRRAANRIATKSGLAGANGGYICRNKILRIELLEQVLERKIDANGNCRWNRLATRWAEKFES
jgi:hypothetical protein